jgi:trk system potassium uptake protein TrkH
LNLRFVLNQLSLLLLAIAAGFVGLAAFALFGARIPELAGSERASALALIIAAAVGGAAGGALRLATRRAPRRLGRREALLLVGLTWIIGGALAALPYLLWAKLDPSIGADHPFHRFIDCWFESISGLTTTGATVLSRIQELPPSLLLWRSITHWLGGLGIVVLFVAVLPSLGTGGKRLFRVEAPGPTHEGVRPHISETSRSLWMIYLALTAACFLGYMVFGMSWFDALCHAFSTLSTGGLSTRDSSIGHYDSIGIDLVCVVFMVMAGVNFNLYYHISRGRWRPLWHDVELRVYLISKMLVLLVIAGPLLGHTITLTTGAVVDGTPLNVLRHAGFAVVSMHTGTGFGTADFQLWPAFVQMVLLGGMFVGGCAGSTAGGIKVVRLWIGIKVMAAELEKAFRPDVVRPLKLGGATIEPELKLSVLAFLLGFMVVLILGAMAVHLAEGDRTTVLTSASAALSCIANVGPGVGYVGPTDNYGWMTPTSKLVLALLMVLGRLEFFAIVVLFTPRFWRGL